MQLTIGKKLMAGFLGLSLLVAVAGLAGINMVGRVAQSGQVVIETKMPQKDVSMEAIVALKKITNGGKDYLLAESDLDDIEYDIDEYLGDLDMFVSMIRYGTESEEFKSSPAGQLYVALEMDLKVPRGSDKMQTLLQDIVSQKTSLTEDTHSLIAAHNETVQYSFWSKGVPYDLSAFLNAQQVNHTRWHDQLGTAVEYETGFSGELDPAKCPFGAWAASYKSTDKELATMLDRFLPAHDRFHSEGRDVISAPGSQQASMFARQSRHKRTLDKGFEELQEYAAARLKALHEEEQAAVSALFATQEKMASSLMQLEGVADREIGMAQIDVQKARTFSLRFLPFLIVFGVFVAVSLGTMITRGITKPLSGGVAFAEELAAGNLSAQFVYKSSDEVGHLAQSLNKMAANIRETMTAAQLRVDYLDNIPTPVMVVDKEFTITYMNPAGAGITGKTPDQLIGMKCYDHFKTNHCRTSECRTTQAIQTDAVCNGETVSDPESLNMPIQYTAAPIKDDQGNLIGALEYVIDISKQKDVQGGVNRSVEVLGAVVSDVAMFAQDMDGKSTTIADQANNVAAAAEEMSMNMTSVSTAAEQSRSNIQAVATATEEMTSTVGEIAQNSEKAREVTLNAVQSVSSAGDRVNELGAAAKEISQVIETIVEIAEQTKLLALNATIEAARAGEAGKGFAVVASEVKDLAKQTNTATEDIRSKIEAIQHSTEGTVGEIGNISIVINEVNEIVSTIATAVEEQSITTRDIAGNITQAADGIQDMVKNVVQAADVSKEVAQNITAVNTEIAVVKSTSTRLAESGDRLKETGDDIATEVARFDQA